MAPVVNNYFGLDKDIYLCFAYIPPQYSSFYVDQYIDFLKLLDNDISLYKTDGSVLILGDFIARAASHHDYIVNDDHSLCTMIMLLIIRCFRKIVKTKRFVQEVKNYCSTADGISFDVSLSLNCTDLYKRGGGA